MMKRSLVAAALVMTFAAAGCSNPKTPPQAQESPAPPATVEASSPPVQTEPVKFSKTPVGGFTLEDLRKATFDVPEWKDAAFPQGEPCKGGRVSFGEQNHAEGETKAVAAASYVDINRDGVVETVALLRCYQNYGGEAGPQQVVVLKRGQRDTIETVGQVVATNGGIKQLGDIAGMSDGTVMVRVRNEAICCETPYMHLQHQRRFYGWNGQRFHQVSGATEFYPSSTATDLSIEVKDVVFGKPVNGLRTAKVTGIVHNNGPAGTEQTVLGVGLFNASLAAKDIETFTEYGRTWYALAISGQKVNEDRRFEFTVVTGEAEALQVSVQVMAIPATANGDYLSDTNTENNGFGGGDDWKKATFS